MKYFSPKFKQLNLDLFRSSLEELNKNNRWVKLGDCLPWTELEKVYNSKLHNQKKGAGNKPARMVLGAMIIKHKLNLSDEDTIQMIQENPYMQYMCGLEEFTDSPIFDPSLFVTLRKRISEVDLNELTVYLMNALHHQNEQSKREEKANDDQEELPTTKVEDSDAAPFIDSQGNKHQGVLKIDATCADAEMRYPVDVDIIHDGCRKVSEYIVKICKTFGLRKPHTNYKYAHQIYSQLVKTSKKKGEYVRETIAQLLRCLRKDINAFMEIVAVGSERFDCLRQYEKRIFSATVTMYHQQLEMWRTKSHTCADRILSIFQPHVRPILRGKAKAKTEFGAKIGASIVNGYTFIDRHSWDAYNESKDLMLQIQLYQERFGYYPSTILADKIYLNKANRKILSDLEINTYCKPLGRPPKAPPSDEQKAKEVKATGDRNEIEATFGTGKRIYRANNIRAKLPETARCWTGMCYFAKNVMKFLRELCLVLTEIWHLLAVLYLRQVNILYANLR